MTVILSMSNTRCPLLPLGPGADDLDLLVGKLLPALGHPALVGRVEHIPPGVARQRQQHLVVVEQLQTTTVDRIARVAAGTAGRQQCRGVATARTGTGGGPGG